MRQEKRQACVLELSRGQHPRSPKKDGNSISYSEEGGGRGGGRGGGEEWQLFSESRRAKHYRSGTHASRTENSKRRGSRKRSERKKTRGPARPGPARRGAARRRANAGTHAHLGSTISDMTLSRSLWYSLPSILNTAVRSRRRYSLLTSRPLSHA